MKSFVWILSISSLLAIASESIEFCNTRLGIKEAIQCQSFFGKADSELLEDLTTHNNDSLSTRALWEITKREPNEQKLAEKKYVFLGFLKAKIRANPPTIWEDCFQSLNNPNSTLEYNDYYRFQLHGVRSNFKITDTEKKIRIEVDDRLLDIKHDFVQDYGFGSRLSVGSSDDCLAAVFHSSVPSQHDLIVIDRESGNVRWKKVCTSSISKFTGSVSHLLVPVVTDDRVVLFGASSNLVYVEAFDVVSGEMLFRFSTDF